MTTFVLIPGAGGLAAFWNPLVGELRRRGHRDDRLFPADFQRRLALSWLGIAPDLVPGGHLAALGHPGEVADRLVGYATAARPDR